MHTEQKVFIAILTAFAVVAIGIALLFPSVFGIGAGSGADPSLVAIPPVTTTNASAKDGTVHSVRTSITLELDKKAQKSADTKALEGKVNEIMSTLDYDQMNGADGSAYIKDSIAQGLATTVPRDQLKDVLITDFQTDNARQAEEPNSDSNTQRDTLLKGMFKSIK